LAQVAHQPQPHPPKPFSSLACAMSAAAEPMTYAMPQVTYAMPQQTYAMPAQTYAMPAQYILSSNTMPAAGSVEVAPPQYVISPNTMPAAASVEVAPAEGVTYTVAPTQQYYIQQPAPVTYVQAPEQAVAAPSYAMGQSYTYIDYENASFVEPAPVVVDAATPVTTTATTTKAKSSKKKGSKKKSSKKFGCC